MMMREEVKSLLKKLCEPLSINDYTMDQLINKMNNYLIESEDLKCSSEPNSLLICKLQIISIRIKRLEEETASQQKELDNMKESRTLHSDDKNAAQEGARAPDEAKQLEQVSPSPTPQQARAGREEEKRGVCVKVTHNDEKERQVGQSDGPHIVSCEYKSYEISQIKNEVGHLQLKNEKSAINITNKINIDSKLKLNEHNSEIKVNN
jgi:hypothetical protein